MTPKEYLYKWCEAHEFETDDDALEEELRESAVTDAFNIDHRRHWYTYNKVADIGGILIMYEYAGTTTDLSAKEAGYKFNWKSVYFVREVERTVIDYEIIKE